MFIILYFTIIFVVLYAFIHEGVTLNLSTNKFRDIEANTKMAKTKNVTPPLDFDFETLVTPNELSILVSKK